MNKKLILIIVVFVVAAFAVSFCAPPVTTTTSTTSTTAEETTTATDTTTTVTTTSTTTTTTTSTTTTSTTTTTTLDVTGPSVSSVVPNGTSLDVVFNEAIDPTTGGVVGSYTITGTCSTAAATSASVSGDTTTLDVDTTGCAIGETVIVTVAASIEDLAGNTAVAPLDGTYTAAAPTTTTTSTTTVTTTTTTTTSGACTPATPNYDFEGTCSWDLPDGYSYAFMVDGSGFSVTEETTQVHGGSTAASYVITTGDQAATGWCTACIAGGSASVDISAWFYDNDPTANARLWASTYTDAACSSFNANMWGSYTVDGAAWQQITDNLDMTGVGGFQICFRGYDGAGFTTSAQFYVDDISYSIN